MKTNRKPLGIVTAALLLALAAGLAWQGSSQRPAAGERKPLYYQDSMHPWIKSDQPGKCTICSMDLTPIYEGQAGFGAGDNLATLSSNQITVLNVQTEPVERKALSRTLRVAGTLEANETLKTVVSAQARGRIDQLFVEYAGVEVERGQKLLTMFSPELVQWRKVMLALTAQQTPKPGTTNAATTATTDGGVYTGDILAPQAGVVLERNVYNGQYVAEGDKLLTIADAETLWFRFDVYQRQLPWFEPGQTLEVEVSGIPGKVFPAVISFVEPAFNEATRTVKVRANLSNPLVEVSGHKRRLLKFGMYAEGHVRAAVPEVLAVPRTAILFPGGASYAYVDKGGGAYERRRLKLGREGDQFWEVLKGLEEGESVVTSGNMLLDAQAQFNLTAKADEGEVGESEMGEMAEVHAPSGVMHPGVVSHTSEPLTMNEPATSASPVPLQPPQAAPADQGITAREAGMAPGASVPGGQDMTPRPAQNTTGQALTLAQGDPIRGAAVAAMRERRLAAIAKANAQKPAAAGPLTDTERQSLQEFLAEAAGLSEALAADNLERANGHMAKLPAALESLLKTLPTSDPSSALLQHLAAIKWQPAKDLADARQQFLPFSTALVDYAKQLRMQDPALAGLKIYHCPMAPKPGLWLQAKGPLANPFYGAEMLRCGEEVKL